MESYRASPNKIAKKIKRDSWKVWDSKSYNILKIFIFENFMGTEIKKA